MKTFVVKRTMPDGQVVRSRYENSTREELEAMISASNRDFVGFFELIEA
jgi:hypothetical protein